MLATLTSLSSLDEPELPVAWEFYRGGGSREWRKKSRARVVLLDGGLEERHYRQHDLSYLPALNKFLRNICQEAWQTARKQEEQIDPCLFRDTMIFLQEVMDERGYEDDAQAARLDTLRQLNWSSPSFEYDLEFYAKMQKELQQDRRDLLAWLMMREVALTPMTCQLALKIFQFGWLAISNHPGVPLFLKRVGPKGVG